ncbi:MAG: hypothetical protein KDB36_17305 [Acidimicrobiales bacterium]|nr:hypothetical protein [Acidimicrobiales bacterium]
MRALITGARMFFAVDQIRKLGDAGHEVFAADTFRAAPGRHSRDVTHRRLVPPPASEPLAFVAAVAELVHDESIDLVLPQFEEVFYLARHRNVLEGLTECFFGEFDVMARLHDKASFCAFMDELGLPIAPSITATTDAELADAVASFDRYFARPVYSRGGVELLTNTGPLAGDVDLAAVHPTDDNPWVVQPFIEGTDVCSFSVVHHGRVTGHATYEHPKTIEHTGGIEFLSIEAPETLEAARRIAEATGYHGQISFDYLRDADGTYWMVECNVRPTAGTLLLTSEEFDDALAGRRPDAIVAPPGRYHQISVALLRDMVHNWREIPRDVHDLFSAPDVYAEDHDPRPLLYAMLSYGHVHQYRKALGTGKHSRKDIMAAQFFDIAWNGEPIP